MRVLVPALIGDAGDPVRVIRECVDVKTPGLLEMKAMYRHASVFGVWADIQSANPDWFVYYLLLSKTVPPGLYGDSDRPNVAWVVVPMHQMQIAPLYSESFHIDGALAYFSKWLPVDAVAGTPAHFVHHLSAALGSSIRHVPGIVRHESGYNEKGSAAMEPWGLQVKNQFVPESVAASNMLIHHAFLTEESKRFYLSMFMRPFYSPSLMNRIISDRTGVFRNGVNLDLVRSFGAPDVGVSRGRVAGSFYRLTASKGVPEVLELYQKMLIAGQLDKVVVTTPHDGDFPESVGDLSGKHLGFDYHSRQTRRDWIHKASTTTVAIWNSYGESSPVAPIEAAAVGCVPIFPDRGWARAMPPWPLIYSNMDEAHAMVRDAVSRESYWRRETKSWVDKHFSGQVLFRVFGEWVESIANSFRPTQADQAREYVAGSKSLSALRETLSDRNQVSWPEVMKIAPPPLDRRGSLIAYLHHDIPFLMEHGLGFRDTRSSPIPDFRRI